MKFESKPSALSAEPTARPITSLASAEASARQIVCDVIPGHPDGWTFDPRRCECVEFGPSADSSLYVVWAAHDELRLEYLPAENSQRDWISSRLELLRRPGHLIGGWPYTGRHFVDVSLLIDGSEKTERLARINQQLAIFHPQKNESFLIASGAEEPVGPGA
jgi:hypothetical protein